MAEGRFQVAVGAVVRHRPTGKILLLYRKPELPGGDIWEYPVGRTKQFETLVDGLKREVSEETGLANVTVDRPFSTFEFMRGEHSADNEVRAIVYAVSTDQEAITLSEEHSQYKWLSIDEAIGLVKHPGVKHDLEAYCELYPSF